VIFGGSGRGELGRLLSVLVVFVLLRHSDASQAKLTPRTSTYPRLPFQTEAADLSVRLE
jgi:hypothetical protein